MSHAVTTPSSQGAGTIVMIEPDILVRMTVAEYLRECGYKVMEGVAADDAFIVLWAGHRVDVVLRSISPAGSTVSLSPDGSDKTIRGPM